MDHRRSDAPSPKSNHHLLTVVFKSDSMSDFAARSLLRLRGIPGGRRAPGGDLTLPARGQHLGELTIPYNPSSVVPVPTPDASPPGNQASTSWLAKQLRLSLNRAISNKNESGDTRLYADGWENAALTPRELAEAIDAGTAYSCELKGRRRAENFKASDVLSVDIDGGRRIDAILKDPLVQAHSTILYTTPSHTEEQHRFRLIFATPRSIEDPAEMRAAARSLALRLNGDLVATDPARLFFGSRGSQPRVWDRGLSEAMLDELIRQSLDAEPVRDDGCSPSTTASRLSLHPEQPVTTASGSAAKVADLPAGAPVHCPFHNDARPSAFVVVSATGGSKGLHCSACAQTFWPAGTSLDHDFFEFDRAVDQARVEFDRHRHWGPLQPFLGHQEHFVREGLEKANIILQDERYLRLDRLEKGLTFIKSPKGTGKTECLRAALARLPGSVLLISHRVALIRHTCERLGLDCYLDFKGKLENKRLGICWDSLGRLEGRNGLARYRTIIIDESEQVLAHSLAGTMSSEVRDRNFKIFRELLQEYWKRGNTRMPGATRIVALDADLGFTTFATLTRLANPESSATLRPGHVVINRHRRAGRIQVFDDRSHLIADLLRSLRDGKRVFVASNARGRIDALAEAIGSALGGSCRLLKITSETNTAEEVVRFIGNPAVEALKYDAILASPTIGTGVDITFEGDASRIDVVYGLFKEEINTHFDMDQQLGRVRHPGEVKVWVSPRRFRFDTAVDVVRGDIHRQNLFKSVLLRYEDGKPVYDMEDPLIDMASLIVSRERASKNNLKRHFIAHKEGQCYTVEIVGKDAQLSGEGAVLDHLGRQLSEEKRIETLMAAEPLPRAAYRAIEERAKRNGEVTAAERSSMARTRIELFHRAPLSPEMIRLDAEGRHRKRIRLLEDLLRTAELSGTSEFRQQLTAASACVSTASRFRRSQPEAVDTLLHLLSLTPVFREGRFDPEVVFSGGDLEDFAEAAVRLKPVVENQLGVEVRRDVGAKPMAQLSAILKEVGLRCVKAGKTRAGAVAGGRTVHLYRLDRHAFEQASALVAARRERPDRWRTLYEMHGWDLGELEADREEEG